MEFDNLGLEPGFRPDRMLEETMEGLHEAQSQILSQEPPQIVALAPVLARLATAMTQAARVHHGMSRASGNRASLVAALARVANSGDIDDNERDRS